MKLNHALAALAVTAALLVGSLLWAFNLRGEVGKLKATETDLAAQLERASDASGTRRAEPRSTSQGDAVELEALRQTLKRVEKERDTLRSGHRGRLMAANGQPMGMAKVQAMSAGDRPDQLEAVTVVTALDGTFAFSGLKAGIHRLSVEVEGDRHPLGVIEVHAGGGTTNVHTLPGPAEGEALSGMPTASPEPPPQGPTGPPRLAEPIPLPSGPRGPSAGKELDELAEALSLSPEQKDEVQKVILEGQNEFEKRLIEAGQRGERDIGIIDRIGQDISQLTKSRIEQLLFPEQKAALQDYMRKLEEGN